MKRDPPIDRLKALSHVLDTLFRVPGTDIRIGLDPIVDLIPVVGDLLGVGASGYILFQAHRLGLPRATLLRMLVNIGIDALIGAVPLLGAVLDAGWKANVRNIALIERHMHEAKPGRRDVGFLLLILAAMLALCGVGVWVTVVLYQWFLRGI